jgi:quercetin dioxygenase-like cupin family protein|tara:strand:- start:5610 stop:6350 length:741 start_codon:yes stop_codon:yes gene_type:complete
MTINKRNDQIITSPFKGASNSLLTGIETGSKMLSVNEITLDPGAKSEYYEISNVEESLFVTEGQVTFRLGENIIIAYKGDCILAKRSQGHGFKNSGTSNAVLITVSPSIQINKNIVEEPKFSNKAPENGFFDRSKNEPFEFAPGIMRHDMVGDFLGAESTYFSELIFDPGAIAPNHYHPKHEESMFCLDSKLNIVYAEDDNISLSQGDMFTCEIAVRHGIYNDHKSVGKLLAIHSVLNPPPRIDVD